MRKDQKNYTTLMFCFVFLTGCVHTRVVTVESEPAGVNIEFDGKYLGKTPVTAQISRKRNEWSDRIYASEVRAYKGSCSQTKEIGKDIETPNLMHFDLTDCLNEKKKMADENAPAKSPVRKRP